MHSVHCVVCRVQHAPKFHFEILASLNLNKNKDLVPWIGEQPYIEMFLWLFCNIIIYIKDVGKMQD